MRKRLIGIVLFAGALGISLAPAGAGPYSYRFGNAQAAVLSADLYGGGTATAYLAKLSLVDAAGVGVVTGGGEVQVLPAPVDQETPGTASEYVGCVWIKTSKGVDSGCRLRPPSTVDFDQLMTKGQVTFSVRSDRYEGRNIIVNLLMTGTGTAPGIPANNCKDHTGKDCSRTVSTVQAACPAPQCTKGPYTIQPAAQTPATTTPVWFYGARFDAQHVLAREMAVIGSVRSEHVGGGAVQSADISRVFSGLNGFFSYDVVCLVNLTTCRI